MNHRAINPDRKPLAPPATSYLKLLGGPQVETTRDNWGLAPILLGKGLA